eukprot:4124984-Prymnesium_polylepis.1
MADADVAAARGAAGGGDLPAETGGSGGAPAGAAALSGAEPAAAGGGNGRASCSSSGGTAGSSSCEGVRTLFCTQNVTGVFDAMDEALDRWIAELTALVDQHAPDFVALHFQEMGGTDWQGAGVGKCATLVAAVHKALEGFWSSGLMLNPDTTHDFSALGGMYLVRLTALDRVRVWDFGDAAHPAGYVPLSELPAPLVDTVCVPPRHCRHERFPQHFFPDYP